MNETTKMLLEGLEKFRKTPGSFALDLRMFTAEFVLHRLREYGWTQRRLADAMGKPESFVSRFLSGDLNWTTETAGAVFCAIDTRPSELFGTGKLRGSSETRVLVSTCEATYGQEISAREDSTAGANLVRTAASAA